MSKHALLSPSSAKRWMECTPSARAGEFIENTSSIYAEEGTEAHVLCEYKVLSRLKQIVEQPQNLKFFNKEMEDSSEEYANFVFEKYENEINLGNIPHLFTEQRLDLTAFIPECFGTADCIIISNKKLFIIDFKYGMGIPVDANKNAQMMVYAIGALEMFSVLYEIEDVEMTIFQPRISNISTYSTTAKELYEWANQILKPKAELAFNGEGHYNAGSWCQFCPIKCQCRTRKEKNMELAQYEFKERAILTKEEISDVLLKVDELISWANDIKEYAVGILLKGEALPGFKLIEGRSTRKFINEEDVIAIVKNEGFDPYSHTLLGITAMTTLLGKTKFNELLGSYVKKPKGKPTLVPENDKRKTIETNDFKDMEEN